MKMIGLALLLLSGCGWRQRDFEKDIVESEATDVAVDVSNKELLEKFETKPIEEKKPDPPPVVAAVKTTPSRKASAPKAKVVEKKEPLKVIPKILPKDFPKDLHEIDGKAFKVWSLYKPNHRIGEKVFLDINYMGMTVGKIMLTNKGKKMVDDKEVWHFHSRFKSAPFYSNIYELDDTVDTFVQADKFLSLKYTLVQRESKQEVDDLQLFDRDKFKIFYFYKRKKANGKIKNEQGERYIPTYSIDPFSIVFFYQGLPLKDGDVYEIPVINKSKLMIMRSVVEGRETIDTDLGKKKAIRLRATTQYSGEQLKSGDLTFWFSDDESRTILMGKAKIKLGSVTAEIVKGQ